MKKIFLLFLVGLLSALLLCGCSQYDDQYDDTDFLTGGANHYAALLLKGRYQNGSYAFQSASFSGVYTLQTLTLKAPRSTLEVHSTLECHKGEAKLLVVNSDEKTIAAQWDVGSPDPMTVTLPAGHYTLRFVGKSAGFRGQLALTLDGEPLAWNRVLESVKEALHSTGETATNQALTALQQAFGSVKRAA